MAERWSTGEVSGSIGDAHLPHAQLLVATRQRCLALLELSGPRLERLFQDELRGAETFVQCGDDDLCTGLADGRVVAAAAPRELLRRRRSPSGDCRPRRPCGGRRARRAPMVHSFIHKAV